MFSEYELGGCKQLEQVKKTGIIEISKTNPDTFEVKKIERLDIISIDETKKETLIIHTKKSGKQLTIKDFMKVNQKADVVSWLAYNLQDDKVFNNTFFLQFTNKLYHIIQQHNNTELRKWVDSMVKRKEKKEKEKKAASVSYRSSCPVFLIDKKVIFEF